MRKGQEILLKRAEKKGFTEEQMDILKNKDIPLETLNSLYFLYDNSLSIQEADVFMTKSARERENCKKMYGLINEKNKPSFNEFLKRLDTESVPYALMSQYPYGKTILGKNASMDFVIYAVRVWNEINRIHLNEKYEFRSLIEKNLKERPDECFKGMYDHILRYTLFVDYKNGISYEDVAKKVYNHTPLSIDSFKAHFNRMIKEKSVDTVLWKDSPCYYKSIEDTEVKKYFPHYDEYKEKWSKMDCSASAVTKEDYIDYVENGRFECEASLGVRKKSMNFPCYSESAFIQFNFSISNHSTIRPDRFIVNSDFIRRMIEQGAYDYSKDVKYTDAYHLIPEKPQMKQYIIYDNGCIYKRGKEKIYSARVQEFLQDILTYDAFDFLDAVMELPIIKESHVFKDLLRDFDYSMSKDLCNTFSSIKWNDCIGVRDLNQLFHKLYKRCPKDINYNRLGASRGFALIKLLPKFNEKSQNIIKKMINDHEIEGINYVGGTCFASTETLLTDYLEKRLIENNPEIPRDDILNEIDDYIISCKRLKRKYNITFKSYKKFIDEIVDMGVIIRDREIRHMTLKIPEKTVFKRFDDELKSMGKKNEFEWITDIKRLVKEGTVMHHCVATYSNRINEDECAIYHLDKGEGYTIEIIKIHDIKDGGYVMNQIQSAYDRGCPDDIRKYVKKVINRVNKRIKNKENRKTKSKDFRLNIAV